MLNIVVINGGRGAASLIEAFMNHQGCNVTSIVNAYDDGKSTGEVRRFFKMLGPSDIRKVQELMLPVDDPNFTTYKRIFQYRFPHGADRNRIKCEFLQFSRGESNCLAEMEIKDEKVAKVLRRFIGRFDVACDLIEKIGEKNFNFSDCSLMNCIYVGAYFEHHQNIEYAAKSIDRLFRLRGAVIPNSIENKYLVALRENGDVLQTEAEIVELRSNVKIKRVYLLNEAVKANKLEKLTAEERHTFLKQSQSFVELSNGAALAIKLADIIIYAPGTQHSSLYPTYLSRGVARTISDNQRALKVFITNIGADYETPTYTASDYLSGAYRYLSLSDDRVFSFRELFNLSLVNKAFAFTENNVYFDEAAYSKIPVQMIFENFECPINQGRHDGNKLLNTILEHFSQNYGGFSAQGG